MESKPHTPSVILKLMGLDELPPRQPEYKPCRVLSEDYLRKSASIGLLKRRSYNENRSFHSNHDKGQEFIKLSEVPEGKANSRTTQEPQSQSGHDRVLNSSNRPFGRRSEIFKKSERADARRNNLRSLQKLENDSYTDSCGGLGIDHARRLVKSRFELEDKRKLSPSRIVVLKPNLVKARNGARYSISSSLTEMSRTRFKVNETSPNESEVVIPPCPSLLDRKDRCQTAYPHLCKSSFAKQAQKQLSERWKMTKSVQEVGGAGRGTTLGEVLAVPYQETRPENSSYNLDISGMSNPKSGSRNQGELKNSCGENDVLGSEENSLSLDSPVSTVASSSLDVEVVAVVETENVGMIRTPEEQRSEPADCTLFMENESSSHVSDASVGQKASMRSHEEVMIPSSCPAIDPEYSIKLGEGYSPSPISVLEPPFGEEILSDTETFHGVGADLHGLQMQLQLLKSESEGPEMVVSSDEESGDGSVDFSEENRKLEGLFTSEESKDFSYLIDVLDEAGFHGNNTHFGFESWYSLDSPMNPSVFEVLEKKYSNQTSWGKPERKLSFDCINLGLKEILQPCMDLVTWAKPLRKNFNLSREVIEEEMWMFLVNRGKEVKKDLSEKALATEIRWFDLREDIDLIVCEMERFLFDELAAELLSIESF